MKTIFNFTDREDKISKSGINPEILIRVIEQETNTVYTPEINIKKKFPPESKIYIQPYSIEGYVGDPVDFGTIKDPDIRSEVNADVSPDQVKFRLKIIENTLNPIKKVLGTCYNIKPWQPANTSLLDVGESKIDSIFQIEVVENEKPRIIFKTGLGLKTDISRSNWLKGIFFTAALREILLKYIIESDQFSECKIRKKFVEHFESLTGDDFPESYEHGKEGTAKWINSAIAGFSTNYVKKSLMTLVSTNWLNENLSKVKIIDCSWHMPLTQRDGYNEYLEEHIPEAIFFDIDKNSEPNADLPHMLPKTSYFQKIVSELGINNEDKIVIYDNSDVFSACRCWFGFFYFGHNSKKLSVLNGGLKKWKLENKIISKKIKPIKKSNYLANEQKDLVKNIKEIEENIIDQKFELIDARNKKRFEGSEPEPRPGLRSGHIKNSKNLPFIECINKANNTFKNKEDLIKIFEKTGLNKSKKIVFTCGSGVTASVLAMAFRLIHDNYSPTIYDGSWSEYGKIR